MSRYGVYYIHHTGGGNPQKGRTTKCFGILQQRVLLIALIMRYKVGFWRERLRRTKRSFGSPRKSTSGRPSRRDGFGASNERLLAA